MMPAMAHALLESVTLLGAASEVFRSRCVQGLEANEEHAAAMIEKSLAMATALAPEIGYDAAAEIAKEAWASGRTVREVASERGVLPPDRLERALDPRRQTEPGKPGRDDGTPGPDRS